MPHLRPTDKLRVAIPEVVNALDVVRSEIARTTGFDARAVFQEVDHSDLVVEVQLTSGTDADPREIAEAVEHSAKDLDVLSTWTETPVTQTSPLLAPELVLAVIDDQLPEPARRALHDEIPTAQWFGCGSLRGTADLGVSLR